MIRGTTPTFEFTLPMLTDEIAAGYITFAQDGRVVIDKDLADCTCAGSTVTLHLTQEETLKLSQKHEDRAADARAHDGRRDACNAGVYRAYRAHPQDGVI